MISDYFESPCQHSGLIEYNPHSDKGRFEKHVFLTSPRLSFYTHESMILFLHNHFKPPLKNVLLNTCQRAAGIHLDNLLMIF